jgi:tetratricopeptide (TPR) repeat protein
MIDGTIYCTTLVHPGRILMFVTEYGMRYAMSLSPADLADHYTIILDKLRQIGEHYFASGQLDRSLQVLAAGHDLVSAPDVPSVPTAELLITYGFVLTWQASLTTGAYTHSLEVLHQAVDLAETLDNQPVLARALDRLGFGYYQQALMGGSGDFTNARSYFEQALALREAHQDEHGICQSRFHVGLIAEREQRFQEAEATFTDVYQLAHRYNFSAEQGEAARHLGFAELRAGNLDAALRLFQEALALAEKSHVQLFLSFAHLSVGEVFHMQHAYDQAQQHYQTAYHLAQAMQVKRAGVQILYSLGELAEDQQEQSQARAHYEAAHSLAQAINFVLGERMITAKLERLAHPRADRND